MNKEQVAAILAEIGTLLELKGESPFKTRAYLNAARAIESLDEPIEKIVAEQRLDQIKGIGESLREKITELVTTGKLLYYEQLKASIPPGLIELLEIPGLGPKRILALREKLGIESVEALEQACREGRVAQLPGFGEKTQANLLEGIQRRRQFASHHLLLDAWIAAEPLLDFLRQHPDVIRSSPAGSLRRSKEIIGDLDLLASSKHPIRVLDDFTRQPGIAKVLAKGETKASVLLEGGLQADLRVVADREFPFAQMYFTGSKAHNIVMRQRAIERGLRLNEYGLFRSNEETRDPKLLVACRDENEVFQQLDLHYIPPELREDMGEFEAAAKGPIPRLLEWTDLKGSLHNHTTWSDGHMTLEETVQLARSVGLSYWAVTDHSRSSFQANGLDPDRLRQQIQAIRDLNRRLEDEGVDFRLLTGTEVDILRDRLDFDDDLLSQLDFVIASLHVPANNEAENTKRLIRAAQNRFVHAIGHPTGRLLLEREAYPVNLPALIDACAETGTWIELNCNPRRFDMDWRHWPAALRKGIRCVLGPDAHRREHVAYLKLGAGVARKGWLKPSDVINTLPFTQLQRALRKKREAK
ncbi:MAG: DNA polymerase/3'-5' exonuclease PolX [Verrucomicrobiota bacterium]|nr:DNA polymerase/3'-5' exonuclease PolX [Limisphaera sp.]MDW8380793.1 DNA polymerase/3'-5' exonuclease PolX [Verrucomicrobiota bacterium]